MGNLTCFLLSVVVLIGWVKIGRVVAERCGDRGGGGVCSNGACCSYFGWCGNSLEHCGRGCQSQCEGTRGVSVVINETVFNEFLPRRNSRYCENPGFYTYKSFLDAAEVFPDFGNSGSFEMRLKEIAAFLAETAYFTSGDLRGKRDPYSWGYCYVTEGGGRYEPDFDYCDFDYSEEYPCAEGAKYYGRGPLQIRWNYNYAQVADYLEKNEIYKSPDIVELNATISFETAMWIWMKPKQKNLSNKRFIPSSHDVVLAAWSPSTIDILDRRFSGYLSSVTNVLDGENACGRGDNRENRDIIGFYYKICDLLGIPPGDNLSCGDQVPFVYEFLNRGHKSDV